MGWGRSVWSRLWIQSQRYVGIAQAEELRMARAVHARDLARQPLQTRQLLFERPMVAGDDVMDQIAE